MRKVMVGGTPVIYARQHHHVLKGWAAWRRANAGKPPPLLLSLDFHTDTCPAFRGICSLMRHQHPGSSAAFAARRIAGLRALRARDLARLVPALRNDEHVDAAQQAGIVGPVFLYLSGCGRPPGRSQTIVRINGADRARIDAALEPASLETFIAAVTGSSGAALGDRDYILDIDLDFFTTERSLAPADPSLWQNLIRQASLITVALEPGWVKLCRLPGETCTARSQFARLLRHIGAALQ